MRAGRLVILFVVIVAGLTAGLWMSQRPVAERGVAVDPGVEARGVEEPASQASATSSAAAQPAPARAGATSGSPAIRTGGRLELDAAELPQRIELEVPELERAVEAEWVKVNAADGRSFDLPANTSIEVSAELFPPGDYLIQMRTNERAPIPLRRYVLTVR